MFFTNSKKRCRYLEVSKSALDHEIQNTLSSKAERDFHTEHYLNFLRDQLIPGLSLLFPYAEHASNFRIWLQSCLRCDSPHYARPVHYIHSTSVKYCYFVKNYLKFVVYSIVCYRLILLTFFIVFRLKIIKHCHFNFKSCSCQNLRAN